MSDITQRQSPVFITIICATYNRESSIARAIESVKSQVFNGWELLIVDDGSTDETNKVVKPFLDDRRIKYLPLSQNKGVGYARNFAVLQAEGEWVLLLDSDNALADCALENIRAAIATDSSIAMHKFMVKNFNGIPMGEAVTKPVVLKVGNFLSGDISGEFHTVVRKEALKAVKFFEKFNGGEGIVWSKVALQYGKVKYHPVQTLIYETDGSDRLSLRSKNISRLAQVYKADVQQLWMDYICNSPSKLATSLIKYFIYSSLSIPSVLKRWFFEK